MPHMPQLAGASHISGFVDGHHATPNLSEQLKGHTTQAIGVPAPARFKGTVACCFAETLTWYSGNMWPKNNRHSAKPITARSRAAP